MTFAAADPGFEGRVRKSFSRLALMRTIGARLVKVAPGEVDVDMPFRDDLTQQHGFVAAGIVTAIVDTACGYAAMSLMPAGATVLTVEYKVNFISSARGDRLIARGRVVKPGRALTICAGEVYSQSNVAQKAVATMLGTMMAVQDRPEVPSTGCVTATQTWDPERYARNARYVTDLAMPVVELLAPRAGERILDLGCGDGVLTEKLVVLGCQVVAVDTSAEQVAAARSRGLDARVMDGERLAFDGQFDAVFSNSALHWMTRADDVIAGVWRALRPDGRFVAELAGHGCIATIVAAVYEALAQRGIDGPALNPWYFPTPDDYARRLAGRGFRVDFIDLIPRPTMLPGDIAGWMETFAESFTIALASDKRPAFVDEVRETLRPKLCDANGRWTADYMLLRSAATKPGTLT